MASQRGLLLGATLLAALSACAGSEDGAPNVEGIAAGAGGTTVVQNGGASGIGGLGGDTASASGGSTAVTDAATADNGQSGSSGTGDAASEQTVNGGGLDGGGMVPMCLTNDVAGGVNRVATNYRECDVEDQAIDFDVAANYPAPRKPGYAPSTTPVTVTDFGTAFSGYAVQECHPYCYKGNLTLGIDVVASRATSLRGEVLFDFPPSVAPIVSPADRASLGWIYLDGPTLPAGVTVIAQMVLKRKDKSLLVGREMKKITLKTWAEFRYFPIQESFDVPDLLNVTSIGFRLTFTATGAQEWHGVIYADHFQLRK